MSSLAIVPTNREIVPVETRIVPANTESAITPYNRPDKSLAMPMGDTPQGAETLRRLAETLSDESPENKKNITLKPQPALNRDGHSLATVLRNSLANFLDGFAGNAIKQLPPISKSPKTGVEWDEARLGGPVNIAPPKNANDPITLTFPAKQTGKIGRVHLCDPTDFSILDTATHSSSGFTFSAPASAYPRGALVIIEFLNKKNYHLHLGGIAPLPKSS